MKRTFINTFTLLKQVFTSTHYTWQQFFIILVVAMAFILMPKQAWNDWELNTKGFWSNIPQTYLNNPNFVYPPWGLILLLPYYLIHSSGAMVLSVFTIGWLAYKREWPFALFFAVVLSPYFIWTMLYRNMDILVIIFPILLWEYSKGRKWEIIARGISLSVMLLKPQCTVLVIPYLLWTSRAELKKVLAELAIVALLVVPISLVGSPPLVFQWLYNIFHPSLQNQFFWSINNISLTAMFGFWIALGILSSILLVLFLFVKTGTISWKNDQTISSLLLSSMYLLPYTSQQSFSSALAFIPSWPGFIYQWVGVCIGLMIPGFATVRPQWPFSVGLLSLIFYSFLSYKNEKRLQPLDGAQQSNS